MGSKLKQLEEMAEDVKQGDLVRIFLSGSDYVGYRWDLEESHVKDQLMLPEDSDVLFCSLNPYGITRMKGDSIPVTKGGVTRYQEGPAILEKIQFIGVNLKTRKLGNEPIIGYAILQRTSHSED